VEKTPSKMPQIDIFNSLELNDLSNSLIKPYFTLHSAIATETDTYDRFMNLAVRLSDSTPLQFLV
jgi:hypothetical protein